MQVRAALAHTRLLEWWRRRLQRLLASLLNGVRIAKPLLLLLLLWCCCLCLLLCGQCWCRRQQMVACTTGLPTGRLLPLLLHLLLLLLHNSLQASSHLLQRSINGAKHRPSCSCSCCRHVLRHAVAVGAVCLHEATVCRSSTTISCTGASAAELQPVQGRLHPAAAASAGVAGSSVQPLQVAAACCTGWQSALRCCCGR
jgi:hypothetical protein